MPVEHHISQVKTQAKSLYGQRTTYTIEVYSKFGHGLINLAEIMFHAVIRSFSPPSAAHALLLAVTCTVPVKKMHRNYNTHFRIYRTDSRQ